MDEILPISNQFYKLNKSETSNAHLSCLLGSPKMSKSEFILEIRSSILSIFWKLGFRLSNWVVILGRMSARIELKINFLKWIKNYEINLLLVSLNILQYFFKRWYLLLYSCNLCHNLKNVHFEHIVLKSLTLSFLTYIL